MNELGEINENIVQSEKDISGKLEEMKAVSLVGSKLKNDLIEESREALSSLKKYNKNEKEIGGHQKKKGHLTQKASELKKSYNQKIDSFRKKTGSDLNKDNNKNKMRVNTGRLRHPA